MQLAIGIYTSIVKSILEFNVEGVLIFSLNCKTRCYLDDCICYQKYNSMIDKTMDGLYRGKPFQLSFKILHYEVQETYSHQVLNSVETTAQALGYMYCMWSLYDLVTSINF